MENTLKQRLLIFLQYLKLGQNAFEKKVGWSNGYISNTKEPSLNKLNDVFRECTILNKGWLLTGEGEMLTKNAKKELGADTQNYKDKYLELLESQLKLIKEKEQLEKEISSLIKQVGAKKEKKKKGKKRKNN